MAVLADGTRLYRLELDIPDPAAIFRHDGLNVVAAIRNGFCRSAFSTRICAANIVSAIGRVSRQSAKRSWRRCPSVPDGAIGWHDGGGKAGAAFHGDNGSYRLSANGVTGIKAEHHLRESPARRKLV